jgi:chromosome transmission fidelity protein 1
LSLAKGPSGKVFNFTFAERNAAERIEELGRTLSNLCTIVPAGMVCFFPSYAYEKQVFDAWSASGMLQRLQSKKHCFREPRSASESEAVWASYVRAVGARGGALLSCVVGGKMSEGINFSDDLARCVVVVGLPYPNPTDVVLTEKMKYLDQTLTKGQHPGGLTPGQSFYEQLCARAVNQSIGRSIRHRGDYAVTVLIDERYSRPQVAAMLVCKRTSKLD